MKQHVVWNLLKGDLKHSCLSEFLIVRVFEVWRQFVSSEFGGEKGGIYLTGIPFLSEEPLCKRLETDFSAIVKAEAEIKQMLLINRMKLWVF